MDDTTKVLIGTISGFIIAFFAEPVKRYFETKSKIQHLRVALYKEMIQNFLMLESTLDDFRSNEKSNIMVGQPLMIDDCYKYVVSQEPALYYQLKEARLINMFYKLLNMLVKIPEGGKEFRTVSAKDIIEGMVGLIQGGLETGTLDKKLSQKVISKKEIEKILNRLGNKAK